MKKNILITLSLTSIFFPVAHLNAQLVATPENSNWILAQFDNPTTPSRPDGPGGQGAGRLYEPPPNISGLPEGQGIAIPPRQSCPDDFLTLQAIVPPDSRGFTAKSKPQFWVYIPSPATNRKATFILNKVEGDEQVEKFEVSLPSQDGIISIQPKKQLISNTMYRWYLRLPCSDAVEIAVEGIVQRVDNPNFEINKRWYDLLSDNIPQNPPPNSEWSDQTWQDWRVNFFTSIGLENLADKPIIN
ncbi:MAG: DUF928 domain-containing protein [Crocosphaera sp.]|nr:DUF928 domain-containing protein [Crocosphaera sp.]